MEANARCPVHFVDHVQRGDLSEILGDAELAALAVRFLRSVDVSQAIGDAEFASLTVQFLRSVYERFVERDGESVHELSDGRWKKPSLERAREFMQEVRKGLHRSGMNSSA